MPEGVIHLKMKRSFAFVETTPINEWVKKISQKYNREYWYNESTGQSVWEDPNIADCRNNNIEVKQVILKSSDRNWIKCKSKSQNRDYWYDEISGETTWEEPEDLHKFNQILVTLEKERNAAAVNYPDCPREINNVQLSTLVDRLKTESAAASSVPGSEFEVIFKLPNDDTAMVTRAIQEDQILKTKLKLRVRDKVVDLPSFWNVWDKNESFRSKIKKSKDPNEAKWANQKAFNYKIATTFMPGYAKALFQYFNAKSVLDPCAGWGDRLVGAASTCGEVEKYVCFDPNRCLRPGYVDLMKLFGHSVNQLDETHISFSNGFEAYALPFEVGALSLPSNTFDLVFTSPPFFDYEMYNPNNPGYVDWIDEFYKPLFIQACRCVKPNHHVAIHIGDTSAGQIEDFLKNGVQKICQLTLIYKIGLHGMMSNKTRTVWIFRKS